MKVERPGSLTDLVRDHVRAGIVDGRLQLGAACHGIVFKVQAPRTRLAHEMDHVRRTDSEHHEVVRLLRAGRAPAAARLLATHALGTCESCLKAISDGGRLKTTPAPRVAASR